MREVAWLTRKTGVGLVQGHQRIDIARVDAVNDRLEHLLGRTCRHDDLQSL